MTERMKNWHLILLIAFAWNGQVAAESDRVSFTAVHAYAPADVFRDDMVELPANVSVHPYLVALLDTMLTSSSSFRRQCARIAAERSLTVRIRYVPFRLPAGVRAVSHISRELDGDIVATVIIHPYDNHVEMIAHEFEHIIEQLDQIDLAGKARRGSVGVYADYRAGPVYETARAQQIGLIVASEIRRRVQRGS